MEFSKSSAEGKVHSNTSLNACSQVIQHKGSLLWPLTDSIIIRTKDKGQRKKTEPQAKDPKSTCDQNKLAGS